MGLAAPGALRREEAVALVRHSIELGVRHIDTANVYAPSPDALGYAESVVGEAAREHPDVLIATKGGVRREGERWWHDGRPDHLRRACHASLRALEAESIELYYLHAVDDCVPIEESVGALAELQREGAIQHIGLSNVDRAQLLRAAEVAPIAAVQNEASPYRPHWKTDGVLGACAELGVAFVAHSPMGSWRAGSTAHLPILNELARELSTTPFGVVLAWLLAEPHVLAIPGATRASSIEASLREAALSLSSEQRERLEASL